MIPARDILASKTRDELRTMLVQKGASYHHNEKAEKLIDRLLEISMTLQPDFKEPPVQQQTQPRKVEPITPATQEQVMEKIQHFKDQGLQVKFSEDGKQFHFRRKAGVLREKDKSGLITERPIIKEDSGTMMQPLERIVKCAQHVMAGGAMSDVTTI